VDAEFRVNLGEVGFDGLGADEQRCRDVAVRHAAGREFDG
jgi:hypothetical protein